jgi:hypothetical protein
MWYHTFPSGGTLMNPLRRSDAARAREPAGASHRMKEKLA